MASINHPYPVTLPNFCNMGIVLRILVLANLMGLAAALLRAHDFQTAWRELQEISLFVQPILLGTSLTLCAAKPLLMRVSYRYGIAIVLAVALLFTALVRAWLIRFLWQVEPPAPLLHQLLLAAAACSVILLYLHMRARILSPAVGEARLQALQARIRPHFLFNSINAVMSVVRSDPKRAERALQDMADLFRVLMGDNRELVTLESEVNLSWQYLELEQLRLGDRLNVAWHIDKMPKDALVPPLVLQPLLENAVYHGVEPVSGPSEITVNLFRARDQVHLVIKNACAPGNSRHAGNKMATQNIRERLALHFDAEASMKTETSGGFYTVHLTMPYVKTKP